MALDGLHTYADDNQYALELDDFLELSENLSYNGNTVNVQSTEDVNGIVTDINRPTIGYGFDFSENTWENIRYLLLTVLGYTAAANNEDWEGNTPGTTVPQPLQDALAAIQSYKNNSGSTLNTDNGPVHGSKPDTRRSLNLT